MLVSGRVVKLDHETPSSSGENYPKIFELPPASEVVPMTILAKKKTICQQKMEIWVNYICWGIG